MNICPKRSEKKGWKNLLANMKVKSRLLVGWKSLMIGEINRVSFWDIYTFIKKKNTIHREYSLQIKELLTTFRNFKFNSMLNENLVEHFFHYFSSFFSSKAYMAEHPHLACEETANYLVIHCLNLEMQNKHEAMKQVSNSSWKKSHI